ncbi:MAG: 4Fe-4S binding protein [Deltaproteobacteria bacterium]|nr:4Fe-4S binding protein [Deltaproteobacteria bacterium]
MKKEGKIIINKDWCKGCGICVAFCPEGALVLDDNEKASWAYPEKCRRCGFCELRCPDIAIELVKE